MRLKNSILAIIHAPLHVHTGYNQELAPDGSDSENNAPNDQDLVVIRRTKLLPEWLDDEDPYAILGGKPQITDSVGEHHFQRYCVHASLSFELMPG